ncbi:MAG TPA: tetratricopeptide repeat protein [Thermosynechococcaceae cyanobacterium]
MGISPTANPPTIALGLERHRSGQVAQAEQIYRQILQQQPDSLDALNLLGALLYQQGQFEAAIELFERVLKLQPHADALNSLGVALKGCGRLQEAIDYYQQALALKPDHAEVLNNLGNALKETNDLDGAIAAYERAISLKPSYPEAHNNLGMALKERGEVERALTHYREALRLKPEYPEAHHSLGVALLREGDLAGAIAAYETALRLRPQYPEALNSLGNALQQQQKFEEAMNLHQQAITLKPGFVEAIHGLANALHQLKQFDAAIAQYEQAIALRPDYAEAHNNLGNALQEQKKLDAAIVHYEKALSLRPHFLEAHSNLGSALKEQHKLEAAIDHFRQALDLNPNFAEVHNNLGNALQEQGKIHEAIACYQTALELKPGFAEIHSNLGNMLQQLGRFEQAFEQFRRAIAAQPDYAGAYNNLGIAYRNSGQLPEAFAAYDRAIELWQTQDGNPTPDFVEVHWNKALTQLLAGDLQQGFAGYEWRFQWSKFKENNPPRFFAQPRWDGSPLNGKTIFLYSEQGMGDTIHFVRFATIVSHLGGRVILECHPPLVNLLKGVAGVDRVVPYGSTIPAFDVHAPLLSLPFILGTTWETIPGEAYLAAGDSNFKLESSDRKIGFVWTGNPENPYNLTRAVPIEQLLALAALPGTQLYSLQKDPAPADLTQLQAHPEVIDLREHLTDFVHTAALIQQLDLVIAIDTAVAHLAGALGKPVWLLLPFAPDWRWMLDRSDSPWYPTVRLFRQPAYGDWASVLAEVREAMEQWTNGKQAIASQGTIASAPRSPLAPLKKGDLGGSQTARRISQTAAPSPQASPATPAKLPLPTELKTAIRLYEAGQRQEAEEICRKLLPQYADRHQVWQLLGLAAHQSDRRDEAIAHYQKVLELDPKNHDTYNNLAVALQEQGRLDEALEFYQKALDVEPNYADAHNNYANALREKGQIEAAIAHYQQAIAIKPDYADAHNNLGLVLYSQGNHEQAAAKYREAIFHRADFAPAHNHLGNALKELGDFEQATAAYQRAIALKPDYAKAFNNWGNVFRDSGDLTTATEYYDRAVVLEPNFAEAHWNKALTLLLGGDLKHGFAEYEWRWQVKLPTFQPMRAFPQPLWDGSPLNGQTIFLHAEQGMGDVLQFVRYVAIVVQRGGRVILEAHPPLLNLLRSTPGVIQVVPYGSPPTVFDIHAPLLSLPHILGITLETIPAEVPYLVVGEGEGRSLPLPPHHPTHCPITKVGLVWSGNPDNPYNRTRAVPIAQLLELDDLPGIQLYSLQKAPTATDLDQLQSHPKVIDLREHLTDFVQTAALIQQLDLVISVDTAVTHLAGAMGKPVWLLLPFAPDWRWLLDRSDSPWYPTMRLFRQTVAGDWTSVLAEVREALQVREVAASGDRKIVQAHVSKQSTSEQPRIEQPKTLKPKLKSRNSLPTPQPPSPPLNISIALQHYEKGELTAAERACREVLQQQPDHLDALHTLGVILCQLQQPDEAAARLQRVLELQPNHAEAWGNLGGALQQQGNLEAAIAHYQKAIDLNPNFADAYQNLAVALQGLDRLEEAVQQCDRVIALKPDLADMHYNRGYMLRRLGRLREAIVSYRRAIDLKPDFVLAHKNLGHALLLTGDLPNGFAEYQWRWRQEGWTPRPFPQPIWDGSPLKGKTILLHAEQGMGDTMQFIRYAKQVKQLGGQVIVECQQPLIRLLAGVAEIDRLIPQESPLPSFDVHASLLNLPHILGTALETIPAEIPYLFSQFTLTPSLIPPSPQFKIGIVWTGNPSHKNNSYRSFSLEQVRSLSLPQTQFYSLQKGDAAAELQNSDLQIVDLSSHLEDFADTAAAIAALDLVITIDTSVAHLAGAMGKPVWVLLSFAPDWRWMVDRLDSPWYPTARLFRQPSPGDWQSVFTQVRTALEQEVQARSAEPVGIPEVPSHAGSEPATIALSWPIDRRTDWGIYGTNLALQLPAQGFVPAVNLSANSSPLDRALLQSIPDPSSNLNRILLQALGDSEPCAVGTADRTIGIVSFEDTNLSEAWLEQARSCDRLITTSRWNGSILQQHGLDSQTILWGVDPTLFHPAPKSTGFGDRFVVFAGGALTHQTAPDLVLAAFQAFHSRHAEALLLTAWQPGPIDPGLSSEAVVNLEAVSDLELSQVLRSIDVALFPNRCTANANRLALAALACGIPTILSANTGHLDLLQHNLGYGLQFQRSVKSKLSGTTGWGESDLEEIVETLERVYIDRQEAQQRGAIAADFLQNWTWAQQMQPLWVMLRSL